jgi:hypothetical protein
LPCPSPASSDTKPRWASDFSVRDKLDKLRPERSASSVMLRGGRRLISCSSGQLSSMSLPTLWAELNQIFGSPAFGFARPFAIAIVRACVTFSISPLRLDKLL